MPISKSAKGATLAFHPTQTLCRSIARAILVVAIALFAVGPQSGSLDTNNDGDPEVPVVVLNLSKGATALPTINKDQRSVAVADTKPPLSSAVKDRFEEIQATELASYLSHSTPSSFDLLRC